MTFEQANKLCDDIMGFLIGCGGPYQFVNRETQINIMMALATGQFLIRITKEGIRYFVCYWCIEPEDAELVVVKIRPEKITGGPLVYVVEAGNKDGLSGVLDIRRRLKQKVGTWNGVFWDPFGKGLQVFAKSKGNNYGG